MERLPLFEEYPEEVNLYCFETLQPVQRTPEELAAIADDTTIYDGDIDQFYQFEESEDDVFSTRCCTETPENEGVPVYREIMVRHSDGYDIRFICHCSLHTGQNKCNFIRDSIVYNPVNSLDNIIN